LSRHFTSRIPIPDLKGDRKGSKFVSLKRLTKKKNTVSDSPEPKVLKKQTKRTPHNYR
jgi:hypothetical protein